MKRILIAAFSIISFLSVPLTSAHADNHNQHEDRMQNGITTQDVIDAQDEWARGIENISKTFIDGGDYKAAAEKHINDLYGYGMGKVLFKPTLADRDKFRETFEEALSYFIGGVIEEDKGFAIKPWSKVRYGYRSVITDSNSATSMGKYYFTPANGGDEIGVEFTFGYFKDKDGNLRINVHHSSLPYSAE